MVQMLLKDSPVGYTGPVGLLWGTAAGEGSVAPISSLLAIPVTTCGVTIPWQVAEICWKKWITLSWSVILSTVITLTLFHWATSLGFNLKGLPALMYLVFLLPSYCDFVRCCKLAILYWHYSCYSSVYCCESYLCFNIISLLDFVQRSLL
jgi:hypothetical protein